MVEKSEGRAHQVESANAMIDGLDRTALPRSALTILSGISLIPSRMLDSCYRNLCQLGSL